MSDSGAIRLSTEVAAALAEGRPVVALESSVLAQGLPAPANRDAARQMLDAITVRGAVPAITAVVDGVPVAGLSAAELKRFLARDGIVKVSARDVPVAMARGTMGATTVAATLAIAARAGIRVFATGGIGGVHPDRGGGAVRDESADLTELSRSPMVVVCAGAKAILDLPGTMERLETLGVTVLGYRTAELPGFFSANTGIALAARVETAAGVAAVERAQRALGRSSAVLVMQAPPAGSALSREEVERAVRHATVAAERAGVRGAALTPWLLERVERETAGASLAANVALLEANAALAAEIALELAGGIAGPGGASH